MSKYKETYHDDVENFASRLFETTTREILEAVLKRTKSECSKRTSTGLKNEISFNLFNITKWITEDLKKRKILREDLSSLLSNRRR